MVFDTFEMRFRVFRRFPLEQSEIRQVLLISSTSVYPLSNGIVTEESPTQASVRVDIEQADNRGDTPLSIAKQEGHEEIVALLPPK